MKTNRGLRSGLLILAITVSLNAISNPAQIGGIGIERLDEALSLMQKYDFEELPPGGPGNCSDEPPVIPNPLIYDAMIISDTDCLKTHFFIGPIISGQAPPGNMALVFTPNGGRIVFPHTPALVAFEIVARHVAQVRITDGQGSTFETSLGEIPVPNPGRPLPIWAFQARTGIAMVELFDFGFNELASVFVETTPAPPLSPGSLTARATSISAVELRWTDYSLVEHGFHVERKVGPDGPWEVKATLGPNAGGLAMGRLEPSTQYFFRVSAINDAGSSLYSNEATATTMTPFTVTFEGSHGDGFVVERSEYANLGELAFANLSGRGALRAGDTAANQQIKAFASFNTSAIPDDAIVVAATLKLKRGTVVGTDPFVTHRECLLDIKGGPGFSGYPALQASDFQAAAHLRSVGVLTNALDGISQSAIAQDGLGFVNKTGVTQFRIYFKLDDDNDKREDWVGWYSSENPEPSNRPALDVTYWH